MVNKVSVSFTNILGAAFFVRKNVMKLSCTHGYAKGNWQKTACKMLFKMVIKEFRGFRCKGFGEKLGLKALTSLKIGAQPEP